MSGTTPVTAVNNTSPNSTAVSAYTCLQTVAENKKKYTKRQVEAADESCKLYHMLGRPGLACFYDCLSNNHIINCPITIDDAKCAEDIYGCDVAFLKGKTTNSPPNQHLDNYKPIPLPHDILLLHPNVTLCCDMFYVLVQVFSLTTSRNL